MLLSKSFMMILCMIILSCFNTNIFAQALDDEDTTIVKPKSSLNNLPKFTYYRIGLDISKIVSSLVQKKYHVAESQLDVFYKNNLFFAAEFGVGNSFVENDYLKYKSQNAFIRLGVDKTFFRKDFNADFDNAFVGLRYGLGYVKRGDASYEIEDAIWGNSAGTIERASFIAHWIELTGGFRMELMKDIFIGWNIRMKALFNPKKFEELPPSYLAGYGKGDKNSAFGYNFYLLYGFGKR
jgi:hypothetical protein